MSWLWTLGCRYLFKLEFLLWNKKWYFKVDSPVSHRSSEWLASWGNSLNRHHWKNENMSVKGEQPPVTTGNWEQSSEGWLPRLCQALMLPPLFTTLQVHVHSLHHQFWSDYPCSNPTSFHLPSLALATPCSAMGFGFGFSFVEIWLRQSHTSLTVTKSLT